MAEVLSPLRDIDKWIRRKLRCYFWKQWVSAGYRELRKRGVTGRKAWNTINRVMAHPCATLNNWEYRTLQHGKNLIHRTTGFMTRSSGGV